MIRLCLVPIVTEKIMRLRGNCDIYRNLKKKMQDLLISLIPIQRKIQANAAQNFQKNMPTDYCADQLTCADMKREYFCDGGRGPRL